LSTVSELDGLVVVLVRARNPLNIGAAARAMTNFGAHRLRVVNPFRLAFQDAVSAVGAAGVLAAAEEFKTVAEAVADCSLVVGTTAVRKRVLENPPLRLEAAAPQIKTKLRDGRVALMFGSEKIGLTNKDFGHCNWLLRIPTQPTNISMNLGQAVAVCLYELARAAQEITDASEPPSEATVAKNQPASAGEIETIVQLLLESLDISFYIKPGTEVVCEKKVRRLLRRFDLETMDAKVLLGMMRQIVWKLREGEKKK
jgi:TrmH family RNA methyltransferase